MATSQVDFRVARSERPPPGRPITVTKDPRHFALRSLSILSLPSLYPFEQE